MKKLTALLLAMFLVIGVVFNTTVQAFSEEHRNTTGVLLVRNTAKPRFYYVTNEDNLVTLDLSDLVLTSFEDEYFTYINEKDGTHYIFFFDYQVEYAQDNEWMLDAVSFAEYTPIFFRKDEIHLKKGDDYYKVDLEKTRTTSKLVVHPINYKDGKIYGNDHGYLVVRFADRAQLKYITKEAQLFSLNFPGIYVTSFKDEYFTYRKEDDSQYIFFFDTPVYKKDGEWQADAISLLDYEPIFFGEDSITVKKGNKYYYVDFEKTKAAEELIVVPTD